MKRLFYIGLALGIVLGFCGPASAQSCYSQSYGQAEQYPAEPFRLAAVTPGETQTFTVPVTVTVTTPSVQVAAPQPVAAPMPSCQQSYGYSAPRAVAVPMAVSYAVPYAVAAPSCQAVGFSAGVQHYGVARHSVGFNQGFVGGNFGAVAGGVNITARDRRGTVVNASGNNNVRIQRGLFGRINGAFADSNRGLLGRITPF